MISLIPVTTVSDDAGNSIEEEGSSREVFANRRRITSYTYSSFHQSGLKPDASFEIRSQDYQGEERCVHNGVEYDVTWVQDRGEWTVLTLSRRLGNA